MTTTSPRFGLTIPAADGSDDANLAALLRSLGLDAENKMPGITALTAAARTALTGAAMFTGRIVYDTDDGYLYQGNGTSWVPLAKLDASKNLPMAGKKITGLADGTAATDAVTKGQLDAAMPVGTVLTYAAASAPSGWLLCYGQAVSRSAYAALFAVVGTTYGAGDGSTTFNLPDLRGRTVAGLDNMGGTDAGRLDWANTLGTVGGTQNHTLTAAQSGVPAHSHPITDPGHAHGLYQISGGGGAFAPNYSMGTAVPSGGAATVNGTTGITVNNNADTNAVSAHNNMQPTMLLNYIIKAT